MRLRCAVVAALMLSAGGLGLSGCNQGPAPGAGVMHGSQAFPAPAPSPTQTPAPVPGNGVSAEDPQIRAAIQAHLQQVSSLNVQAFDTDVTQLRVQGDHAQAEVDFRVKNGQGVMQFAYQLERRGGNWTVTQSTPLGAHQEQGQGPH